MFSKTNQKLLRTQLDPCLCLTLSIKGCSSPLRHVLWIYAQNAERGLHFEVVDLLWRIRLYLWYQTDRAGNICFIGCREKGARCASCCPPHRRAHQWRVSGIVDQSTSARRGAAGYIKVVQGLVQLETVTSVGRVVQQNSVKKWWHTRVVQTIGVCMILQVVDQIVRCGGRVQWLLLVRQDYHSSWSILLHHPASSR